jgi:PAS domain S-box-containing protein
MWQLGVPTSGQSQGVPDVRGNPAPGKEATAAGIAPDLSKKNVLLLHAYTYETASYLLMDPVFLKGLTEAGLGAFNLHFEFMDLWKHPEPASRREFVKYLSRKFAKQPIDLIIALHSSALNFLVEEGKNLFPGTPVINVIAGSEFVHGEDVQNPYERRTRHLKRPFIILPVSRDVTSTVASITKLQPGTRSLVVIAGSGQLDRMMEQATRRGLQEWQGRLAIEYWGDLPLEEVLKRVATLDRNAAILFVSFGADADGRAYSTPEVARRISGAAKAPTFGLFETVLDKGGIVGGFMPTYKQEAARTVTLALEILRGKLPTDPVTITMAPFFPMFDWEQLERWGMNASALPSDAIILNKPVTAWERYKVYIIATVFFCLAETALIIFLMVQRRRKKVAEESQRKTEKKYRNIFEGAVEGIFETTPEGQSLTANPALVKMLGYDSPDEFTSVIHDSAHQLFADSDKRAEYVELLEKQGVVLGFECELLRRDGTKIWVSLNSRRVPGPDGKTLYYSGFLEDITERKRADEELEKYQEHLQEMVRERTGELIMARDQADAANRAKSSFLAKMSHELRTPLTSILGIGQLMERDPEFPQKQRELLAILSRSGRQLFDLIDDVLEVSKIEAGQTITLSKTFDLHRFLDELEDMMSLRAEKKGLRLIFERDSALPKYIQTDARKLRQILINLLGNAIKFTQKGRVTLRVKFTEGMGKAPENEPGSLARLEFEVEDTGIGIAEEDMEKIFEPFVQLNPGQEPSRGIGLGLAISRKFADLLGGKITLRSQGGRGSTFKLDIGGKRAEHSDIPSPVVAPQVMGLVPGQPEYRLLIVDDIFESRLLFRQLLEPVGFRVLEAASGQEALELYSRHQPHLIWMDIRMPGMDGYEAAEKIRKAESQKQNEGGHKIHTPIIAWTAGVMEDKGSSPLSWVFDDWVYKPFRETEVFDKIEKHLGVQFVYRSSDSSTAKPDHTPDKAALTSADLSILPADWLKEFFQTMKKGRSKQLMDQIDRIRPEHADLAQALAELIRVHQFDMLISLTQEALKANADG